MQSSGDVKVHQANDITVRGNTWCERVDDDRKQVNCESAKHGSQGRVAAERRYACKELVTPVGELGASFPR